MSNLTHRRTDSSATRHWRANRLSLTLVVALAGSLGCDGPDNPPRPPTRNRSDQVAATGTTRKPKATATTKTPPPRPPRTLCPATEKRPAPEELTTYRVMAGAKPLAPLRYGAGRWQWINVWAAWCKPCIAEMPRLLQWRNKLQANGVPVDLWFVSIDDDEREMTRFMRSQPKKGIRASYWLETEKGREAWFESIGFDDTPELPVHALVAPDGKLTCVIKGALEPSDYDQLAGVFKGQ